MKWYEVIEKLPEVTKAVKYGDIAWRESKPVVAELSPEDKCGCKYIVAQIYEDEGDDATPDWVKAWSSEPLPKDLKVIRWAPIESEE